MNPNEHKVIQYLDKWIALVDEYRTVEKKAEEKNKFEYFKTYKEYGGFGFERIRASGINEMALKFIQDAEKKGLVSVEYKFFKKIADLGGGYEIKRPKEKQPKKKIELKV